MLGSAKPGKWTQWAILALLTLFLYGCSRSISAEKSISDTATPLSVIPTQLQQTPTRTVSPAATPESVPQTTPIPNHLGLTIEEYEVSGKASLAAIHQQHAELKQKSYPYTLPYPMNGNSQFKAFHDTKENIVKVVSQNDGITIFEIGVGDVSPISPLRGFWVDPEERWILEIAFVTHTTEGNAVYSNAVGQIYRDGEFLNEQFDYDEMFGYQLLDGKPFYFYKKDALIHLSFNHEDLAVTYDEVTHYGCCSAAERNPVAANNWIGFWGQRDGVWYYTEIGRY